MLTLIISDVASAFKLFVMLAMLLIIADNDLGLLLKATE